jgi:hypothetical protein
MRRFPIHARLQRRDARTLGRRQRVCGIHDRVVEELLSRSARQSRRRQSHEPMTAQTYLERPEQLKL